ncbi:MAG TPA: NAD(P)H-flavin reductase [Gammaproteobacteria bacterium]|nr:NAD(P)H-flavin reductase [Gammaproteobacteria bacterium]
MTRLTTIKVKKKRLLAPDILQVILVPNPASTMEFLPGQYISIHHEGIERYFSIANAPQEDGALELHIRRLPGNDFTTYVFEVLSAGDTLSISGPFGMFRLQPENGNHLIFVAGGTGFAPIKSFIEHHLEMNLRRPIRLYRGARSKADLYLDDLCRHWQRQHLIDYIPVLSDADEDTAWHGRKGMVHEAIVRDQPRLEDCEVYACGPPAMITALRGTLLGCGLPPRQFHSEGG